MRGLGQKNTQFWKHLLTSPGVHQHLRKITFESHLQWQGLIGEIEPLKARNPRCLCEWSVFLRFPQGKLIRTGTSKSHKPRASFTFFCMRLNTTQENSESSQFPWEKCQNNRAILIKLAKTQNLAWPNAKTTLHREKPTPSKQIVDLLTAALCRRYRRYIIHLGTCHCRWIYVCA